MNGDMRAAAARILSQMPCALEMPAGTGKTQLVAGITTFAASAGARTLILTHTNAGVAALRRRLKEFGVAASYFHIDTITGWAFSLIRHYPQLAGIEVPPSPRWDSSEDYIEAAIAVSRCAAIKRMYSASFRYLLVDEYQDCFIQHHAFMSSIADAVEGTAVFGDRLQGIFDFKGQALVDWDRDVFPRYPLFVQSHVPWRWIGHNDDLGEWLLEVRGELAPGQAINLDRLDIPGVEWRHTDPGDLTRTAFRYRNAGGSTVVIDKWRQGNVRLVQRLGGGYTVMEDLNGRVMHEALQELSALSVELRALWFAQQMKRCFSGLSKIDKTVLKRLEAQKPLGDLKRPEHVKVMQLLQSVSSDPSYRNLAVAMEELERCGEAKLYSHESWRDMTAAIRATSCDGDKSLQDNLTTIRDRARYGSRARHRCVVSRTVLVKGLEYDRAIIADGDSLNDIRNFYVALTRPRNQLTIFSTSPIIRLQ